MLEGKTKTGAVLVIGGGIAGVQSSLDLAEMGYSVYRVEESPDPGGSLLQAGSAPPAEDDFLCLASHKLGEAAGNPFIRTLVNGEVLDLKGEPGKMKARVKKNGLRGETEEIELEIGAVILAFGQDRPVSHTSLDRLCSSLGVQRTREGFLSPSPFDPVATSRPGIYGCGAAKDPKDMKYLLLEASAAAGRAAADLEKARLARNPDQEFTPIQDRSAEPPRVGVFICECGCRMSNVQDVHALIEHVREVVFTRHVQNLPFACRTESQARMRESIREHDLNRIVVACSPSGLSGSVFLPTLRQAGLDQNLFHRVLIGGCDGVNGLQRAKDLLQAAVLKAALHQPRTQTVEGIVKKALVIGGNGRSDRGPFHCRAGTPGAPRGEG